MIAGLRRLAVLSLVAVATRAAAQEQAALPACGEADPEAAPCRAHYDTAPVLALGSEPPLAAVEARKPLVWMYVDAFGFVRRAQVHQPTRPDFDIAALERAREFRFRPALLEGRAVAAWILMPVSAVPPPASCADVGPVPPSAGGVLVDSIVFLRPEMGRQYTYAVDGFGIDLFVYPHVEGETPRGEVEKTLAALREGPVRGGPDSVTVLRAGAEHLRPSRPFRDVEFAGYSAVFRATLAGVPVESYVAVFPAGEQDLKVRATPPRTRAAREQVGEFVQQILSNRAWRMKGCPR